MFEYYYFFRYLSFSLVADSSPRIAVPGFQRKHLEYHVGRDTPVLNPSLAILLSGSGLFWAVYTADKIPHESEKTQILASGLRTSHFGHFFSIAAIVAVAKGGIDYTREVHNMNDESTKDKHMPTEHTNIPGGDDYKTLSNRDWLAIGMAGPPVRTSWDLTTSEELVYGKSSLLPGLPFAKCMQYHLHPETQTQGFLGDSLACSTSEEGPQPGVQHVRLPKNVHN
ncbi:hypothetical protein B0H13DRAFT_1906499 [Mycena leptocephala]|nr:hypothetical protein B0H13DRAFT_1906499 [Mycena leptocephala]